MRADSDRSKHFVVAVSAVTGEGMEQFYETLQSALNLYLQSVTVFVPYNQDDGVIAQIHQQGEVDHIEYQNEGTLVQCKIPEALRQRLVRFELK
jgi:GTP-binding protein HflX